MSSDDDPEQERIETYIDENLKRVFLELQEDELPEAILNLLVILRAQDEELKGEE